MTFARLPIEEETYLFDVRMFGQEGFGAIYLIADDRKAIIETGTSWDAARILEAVRAFGLRPADIDALIVSHIHLDHAGGAGFLLEEMSRAKVYVHQRGFKHLADPTRLLASAREALGPEESQAFGTMRPIPADRLVAVKEGDRLELGKHVLRFLDSPGHAPHELTILDERTRCMYTGDAAGLYFPGDEILMPIAPAPAFDLGQNLETLQRILALEPKALLFSHYGPHANPKEAIDAMMIAYPAWARAVKESLGSKGPEGVLRHLYDLSVEARSACAGGDGPRDHRGERPPGAEGPRGGRPPDLRGPTRDVDRPQRRTPRVAADRRRPGPEGGPRDDAAGARRGSGEDRADVPQGRPGPRGHRHPELQRERPRGTPDGPRQGPPRPRLRDGVPAPLRGPCAREGSRGRRHPRDRRGRCARSVSHGQRRMRARRRRRDLARCGRRQQDRNVRARLGRHGCEEAVLRRLRVIEVRCSLRHGVVAHPGSASAG